MHDNQHLDNHLTQWISRIVSSLSS